MVSEDKQMNDTDNLIDSGLCRHRFNRTSMYCGYYGYCDTRVCNENLCPIIETVSFSKEWGDATTQGAK